MYDAYRAAHPSARGSMFDYRSGHPGDRMASRLNEDIWRHNPTGALSVVPGGGGGAGPFPGGPYMCPPSYMMRGGPPPNHMDYMRASMQQQQQQQQQPWMVAPNDAAANIFAPPGVAGYPVVPGAAAQAGWFGGYPPVMPTNLNFQPPQEALVAQQQQQHTAGEQPQNLQQLQQLQLLQQQQQQQQQPQPTLPMQQDVKMSVAGE